MTSDYVKIRIDDSSTVLVMMGLVGRKNIASDSMDLGTMVSNATWSAYCEGLEAAIGMVDLVTKKSFQVLAEQRMKAEDPKVQ